MVGPILLIQSVMAPLICAALCLYVRRKNMGGDYLVMWAICFALIGATIATASLATPPHSTSEVLLGWSVLSFTVTASSLFLFFGTLALIGYAISIRRATVLTATICLVLQIVQYADVQVLRLGSVAFTAVMMAITAVIFFTKSRSMFYVMAGLVTLMRGANSLLYIYMSVTASEMLALPAVTAATTVFVNLAMGLCLLLITFDNAQKELKKANDAESAAKQLAEELYRENASIVRALDASQDRICIEDQHGTITYANKVVFDIWGKGHKDNVIGLHFNDAFPFMRHLREAFYPQIMAAFQSGDVWDGEFDITRPDGKVAHNELRVMRLPDNCIIYTVKDVTENYRHKQREQQLKQQLIEAQRMESVGRLAGGVAHDFNNIIAAIRAFGSLITDALAPDLKARSFAQRIVDSCDRAAELVRQILLFSRASQADLNPIAMADVIGEVHQYVRANMPANIGLKVEMPRKTVTVRGNTGQLIQVFMNLVINARDAIGANEGRIQIFSHEVELNGPELDALQARPDHG